MNGKWAPRSTPQASTCKVCIESNSYKQESVLMKRGRQSGVQRISRSRLVLSI